MQSKSLSTLLVYILHKHECLGIQHGLNVGCMKGGILDYTFGQFCSYEMLSFTYSVVSYNVLMWLSGTFQHRSN